LVNPYNNDSGKKNEVRVMFNTIARNYDFLNHFLSFGIDKLWRKRLVKELRKVTPNHVIDIATGTADLAIMAVQRGIPMVTGIDLSENMIEIGNQKISKLSLKDKIFLSTGDAESLLFEEGSFDAAMVSFGVRNFEELEKGLIDIQRVIKPGGSIFILEFSQPERFPFKQLYRFYSFNVLPLIGKIISNDSRAYTYLPESIREFPYGSKMVEILGRCGFEQCRYISLTFQVATIYIGVKK
jgi:demethylmenaquinone methyltransferase/2-methoxy-6-polyprenyl-1,4-benzoquinol methylase